MKNEVKLELNIPLELEKVRQILKDSGDSDTHIHWDGNRYIGQTDKAKGRKCLISGVKHDSNGCVLFVKPNGEVWYHCHSTTSHKGFQGKQIGNISSDKLIQFTNSNN